MYDYESLGVDFIELAPRALPQDWIAITAAEVAEMPRQAGAREPWHAAELGCYSLAQCISNPRGYQSVHSAAKPSSKKRPGHDLGVHDGTPPRTKAGRERDAID